MSGKYFEPDYDSVESESILIFYLITLLEYIMSSTELAFQKSETPVPKLPISNNLKKLDKWCDKCVESQLNNEWAFRSLIVGPRTSSYEGIRWMSCNISPA